MKIKCLIFLLLPLVGFASNDDLTEQYFPHKDIILTPQEREALAIGKKWQTGMATSKPIAGRDGAISFVFGSGQTQIVCAVLQACDIALQPGEQFNNFNVGDERFYIEPSISNTGDAQQVHLILKARAVGMDTSLVVTTDRRTYHFRLRSTQKDFMPFVSFIYPDEIQEKWNAVRLAQAREHHNNTLPVTGEYLGDLNFNYLIQGNARWKPCRVYNDSVKTIIEMPKAMQQSEAPALLVLRHHGLFRKTETVMVNYRIQNNRFIVDSLFDRAILIVGVGRSQEKITIIRQR